MSRARHRRPLPRRREHHPGFAVLTVVLLLSGALQAVPWLGALPAAFWIAPFAVVSSLAFLVVACIVVRHLVASSWSHLPGLRRRPRPQPTVHACMCVGAALILGVVLLIDAGTGLGAGRHGAQVTLALVAAAATAAVVGGNAALRRGSHVAGLVVLAAAYVVLGVETPLPSVLRR